MRRGARILIALAVGALTAVIAYASARGVERLFFPEPNPALVVWSERSAFLWRALLALYVGGLGAFGGHALAASAPLWIARWLWAAMVAAALALLVVSGIAP